MRLKRSGALLGASVLALAAVAIGCTGSEDEATFGDYGGQVQLQRLNLGTTELAQAFAEFYTEYTPATGEQVPSENPYAALPLDTCVPSSAVTIGTDGTYTSANVGANVRIVGDGGTITMPVNTVGSYTYYETSAPGPGTDVPPASFADVEWDTPATSLADAIGIPEFINVTAPDPASPATVVPTSGVMTFTWTSVGAEEILISFLTSPGGLCRLSDDGSFDVPASFLAAINNTSGFVAIVAIDLGFENVDFGTGERSVNMIGYTGQAWQY